jgi:hypothetical protein
METQMNGRCRFFTGAAKCIDIQDSILEVNDISGNGEPKMTVEMDRVDAKNVMSLLMGDNSTISDIRLIMDNVEYTSLDTMLRRALALEHGEDEVLNYHNIEYWDKSIVRGFLDSNNMISEEDIRLSKLVLGFRETTEIIMEKIERSIESI